MDDNTARVAMIAIIGAAVVVSMIAAAIARVFAARRRPSSSADVLARVEERLVRIEQAIDAMATEVERVSESQRFSTRLLAEGRPPAADAVPVPMLEQSAPAERRR